MAVNRRSLSGVFVRCVQRARFPTRGCGTGARSRAGGTWPLRFTGACVLTAAVSAPRGCAREPPVEHWPGSVWTARSTRCRKVGSARRSPYQGADRGTVQAEDEIALPVPRRCPLVHLGGTRADQQLRRHEAPPRRPRAGARHAQRPASAQTRGELAPQGPATLHVERLVDRFVADAHREIVREVALEPTRDLRRTPRTPPPPVLAPAMPTPPLEHRRAADRRTAWRGDHARQPVLHILPEPRVRRQLG